MVGDALNAGDLSLAEVKTTLTKSFKSKEPGHFIRDFLPAPSNANCWKKFGQIVDTAGEVVYIDDSSGKQTMMVACHSCQAVFCYKPCSGTSSLVNHVCKLSVSAAFGQQRIDKMLKPKALPSQLQVRHCTRLCAEMCAEDFRPFHIVSCSGFRNVLQYVLDVGVASKARMEIDDLLTDERTVKRMATECQEGMEKQLVKLVRNHLADKLGVGSTTDLYKNKDTGIYYMTVTLTLIDESWRMTARTLGCIEFPENMAHTGVNILAVFNRMMNPYCSADLKKQVHATTDGASNNNAIGDEYPHSTCQCHIISTCVQFVLEKRTRITAGRRSAPFYDFLDQAPLHFEMIDAGKDLVRWVKQADCNTEPKLKKGCPTRWDNILLTLESIWVDYDKKCKQLDDRRPSAKHRIEAVDYTILEEMVRFLTPFKLKSKMLESTNSPTIHLSCIVRDALLKHCAPVETETQSITTVDGVRTEKIIPPDSEGLINIKRLIHDQIMEKFILQPIHFAGAFLDPRQKFRLASIGIDDTEIAAGIAFVIDKMRIVGPGKSSRTPAQVTRAARSPKRRRIDLQPVSMFDVVESDSDDGDETKVLELQIMRELAEYKSHRVDKASTTLMNASDEGLLMWWKSQAAIWPILSRAARWILAASASSAKSEHNFSEVGNHISKKRTQLKPKTVNTLMILRSNKDLRKR